MQRYNTRPWPVSFRGFQQPARCHFAPPWRGGECRHNAYSRHSLRSVFRARHTCFQVDIWSEEGSTVSELLLAGYWECLLGVVTGSVYWEWLLGVVTADMGVKHLARLELPPVGERVHAPRRREDAVDGQEQDREQSSARDVAFYHLHEQGCKSESRHWRRAGGQQCAGDWLYLLQHQLEGRRRWSIRGTPSRK